MWFLMAVAMMLPSAAPMIRTYCEIADTAAERASRWFIRWFLLPVSLRSGSAASLAFAGLDLCASALLGAVPAARSGGGHLRALRRLRLAGLYQFSGLKEACLKKCRNPFSILFARWSAQPAAFSGSVLEQGFWCLGCCWALMLVMFAVGVMNVFWMALIALVYPGGKTGAAAGSPPGWPVRYCLYGRRRCY